MSWNRLAAGLLSTAVAVLAAMSLATPRARAAGDAPDPKVARGKYLVTIMSCNDCHTPGTFYGAPDPERFLAGSEMGWAGPWGVSYAANLTPDPETGLGKWKPAEIAHAIRTGNRPDGRQLSAAMPWQNFRHLTEGDALAIAAYLGTLKPVKHAVPKPVEPGTQPAGPVLQFPPPSAWDAPRGAPEGAK